jgi:hypothetical protein
MTPGDADLGMSEGQNTRNKPLLIIIVPFHQPLMSERAPPSKLFASRDALIERPRVLRRLFRSDPLDGQDEEEEEDG